MSNKIEFTDSAKKEIDRVVSEKGSETYFRISKISYRKEYKNGKLITI